MKTSVADYRIVTRSLLALHEWKSEGYGHSWRKHGEHMSIMANVARKYDRLERLVTGHDVSPETWIDTVADLAVYASLYAAWLAYGPSNEPDENLGRVFAYLESHELAAWGDILTKRATFQPIVLAFAELLKALKAVERGDEPYLLTLDKVRVCNTLAVNSLRLLMRCRKNWRSAWEKWALAIPARKVA